MTDDEFEQALRESLETRAAVRDEDIRPLRGYITALPPRRRRRRGGVLAAAAGIVVMLGVAGLLVANLPLGSGGAAPDSRLAVCGVTAADAEAIFSMDHVRDYSLHLPAAYPLVGLQADPEAPALVIVLKGPASADRAGNSPGPGNHDLCMVVGTGEQPWQRVDIVDVDTTGMIGFIPEPTGTPFADDKAPWAERCGGADPRILDVYPFDHGTDIAARLALDPSPPELDTDDPGAVIVYADTHPFPALGTPPTGGATIAPREPLAPDRHDICVLVGADPATAARTIHEDVGVATIDTSGPPPTAGSSPSTTSDGLPAQLDPQACRRMNFTDERCLAIVERALSNASIALEDVDRVALETPTPGGVRLGGGRVFASVTFTLQGGTELQQDVGCAGIGGQYSLVCTDNPEIRLSAPYGGGGGYHDLPCGPEAGGDPGSTCATPMPAIKPGAAALAVPLEIASRDIPIPSAGHLEIDMGGAALPNGILSDASFALADPHTQAFRVADGVRLEVRSLDPSRPPFDNVYVHGWYPGTEDVEVYLVLDVTSFTPGAMLEVRDLVVR